MLGGQEGGGASAPVECRRGGDPGDPEPQPVGAARRPIACDAACYATSERCGLVQCDTLDWPRGAAAFGARRVLSWPELGGGR